MFALGQTEDTVGAPRGWPNARGGRGVDLSKLGSATTYTLALWERLARFLKNPERELSNPSSLRRTGYQGHGLLERIGRKG